MAKSVLVSHVTHPPGAYPGFLLPLGWDACSSGLPLGNSSGFPENWLVPIYTPGWRGAL